MRPDALVDPSEEVKRNVSLAIDCVRKLEDSFSDELRQAKMNAWNADRMRDKLLARIEELEEQLSRYRRPTSTQLVKLAKKARRAEIKAKVADETHLMHNNIFS